MNPTDNISSPQSKFLLQSRVCLECSFHCHCLSVLQTFPRFQYLKRDSLRQSTRKYQAAFFRRRDFRVQVIKDGKKRKLVINGCKLEDAGKITCKTNADESSADLGVKCE